MDDNKTFAAPVIKDSLLQERRMTLEKSFPYVDSSWLKSSPTVEEGRSQLAVKRMKIVDIVVAISLLRPCVSNGRFCLQHQNGRLLFPDPYALKQLGTIVGIGTQYPSLLFKSKRPADAHALAFAFKNPWPERSDKRYLLRIEDEKLRAVLPENRDFIPNDWLLGVLQSTIPGGRLSHLRGDVSSLFANVLVPETIRQESDSDYAFLVAVSNCEIGKRRFLVRPSIL